MLVDESYGKTMYATKRRKRSSKSTTSSPSMKEPQKSNPSKRHRLRLNAILDEIASCLPYEQSVISRLDRLSILRLSGSFLRTKSYFQAALHNEPYAPHHPHIPGHLYSDPGFTDTDSVLQALSGFLFIVTADGEVFYASRTVEQYLGFHQSDITHQSALELIHSEDREEFKNKLNWRTNLPPEQQDITLQEVLQPDNCHLLQRSFTVRFRCLLDNTSGFITLEISGRIKVLHGQNLRADAAQQEPQLALFALCCPFGPLPLLDVPPRDYTFKSKHKMDMAPVSMDHRGRLLFNWSDRELLEKGGYDLIHPDDMIYYSLAHREMIKTGSSGLIAYRLMARDMRWLWLQTSSKVIYKNSKPDYVICTHRHLTEDEGRDLVRKRGTEFKLPYPILDTDCSGLDNPVDDVCVKNGKKKKAKTPMKDYLHTGRKRKANYRDSMATGMALNGAYTYPGLNGYPQSGDIKPDSYLYPYAAATTPYAALDPAADMYRASGYAAGYGGSLYPSSADAAYRLEAEKAYANAGATYPYAPTTATADPAARQYQHTLQYYANSDPVSAINKYGSYELPKYGYDYPSAYGLDLSKRTYDDELKKYSYDYATSSDNKLPKITPLYSNGMGDSPYHNASSLCDSPAVSTLTSYRSSYDSATAATNATSAYVTPTSSRTTSEAAAEEKVAGGRSSMTLAPNNPYVADPASGVQASEKLAAPGGGVSSSLAANASPMGATTAISVIQMAHKTLTENGDVATVQVPVNSYYNNYNNYSAYTGQRICQT